MLTLDVDTVGFYFRTFSLFLIHTYEYMKTVGSCIDKRSLKVLASLF
jgi:hypothetical protein